jgi:hypothetical protein
MPNGAYKAQTKATVTFQFLKQIFRLFNSLPGRRLLTNTSTSISFVSLDSLLARRRLILGGVLANDTDWPHLD